MNSSLTLFGECSSIAHDDKVVVRDAGRSLMICFHEKCQFVKTKLDNCVFPQLTSADFLVETEKSGVIVELKGKDVMHALKQIESTVAKLKSGNTFRTNTHAVIFSRRCPLTSSSLQTEKNRIFRSTKVRIFVSSSNNKVVIDEKGCRFK